MSLRNLWIGVGVMLAVACSNPADNTPDAIVSDAVSAPVAAATAADDATAVRYVITPDSKIEFTGSKVTGKHDGGFRNFTGTIHYVEGDPGASRVEVSIDLNSMWTDNDRVTSHLKTDDFFDVPNFPEATFRSTNVVAEGDHYLVSGDLAMHGITKNVTFPAHIEVVDGEIRAQAEFDIRRFDWGIQYQGRADDLVRDEVVIRLNIIARPESGVQS